MAPAWFLSLNQFDPRPVGFSVGTSDLLVSRTSLEIEMLQDGPGAHDGGAVELEPVMEDDIPGPPEAVGQREPWGLDRPNAGCSLPRGLWG